jgi:predicted membrane protein
VIAPQNTRATKNTKDEVGRMMEFIRRCFNLKRDNNYYFGLLLLKIGIATIFVYLLFDAFELMAFFVTAAISGWGFVLLWKSDNDYRFQIAKDKIVQLENEIQKSQSEIFGNKLEKQNHFKRRKLALSRGAV